MDQDGVLIEKAILGDGESFSKLIEIDRNLLSLIRHIIAYKICKIPESNTKLIRN